MERNKVYYEKFPQDIKRIRNILAYLESAEVRTPNGGRISPNRWLQLGIKFGMKGAGVRIVSLVVYDPDYFLFRRD